MEVALTAQEEHQKACLVAQVPQLNRGTTFDRRLDRTLEHQEPVVADGHGAVAELRPVVPAGYRVLHKQPDCRVAGHSWAQTKRDLCQNWLRIPQSELWKLCFWRRGRVDLRTDALTQQSKI
jgi:hypothetical protein